jgi:hypothetical protein
MLVHASLLKGGKAAFFPWKGWTSWIPFTTFSYRGNKMHHDLSICSREWMLAAARISSDTVAASDLCLEEICHS